jgi:hypothetical protein
MKTEKYSSKALKIFLKTKKVCTLDDLMKCLGTNVRKTVFRKLAEVEYQTSYSHHGKYYVLKSNCKFNQHGLWHFDDIWFSIFGTLLETSRQFVEHSDAGYSTEELSQLLHVSAKQALLNLQNRELLIRQKFEGKFIYFSADDNIRQKQVLVRGSDLESWKEESRDLLAHEIKAAIILFFGLLDERQRRLFAGVEAIRTGKSDARISEFLGLDPHTVAKGRCELLERDIDSKRLRRPGGGRKRQEKKLQK